MKTPPACPGSSGPEPAARGLWERSAKPGVAPPPLRGGSRRRATATTVILPGASGGGRRETQRKERTAERKRNIALLGNVPLSACTSLTPQKQKNIPEPRAPEAPGLGIPKPAPPSAPSVVARGEGAERECVLCGGGNPSLPVGGVKGPQLESLSRVSTPPPRFEPPQACGYSSSLRLKNCPSSLHAHTES